MNGLHTRITYYGNSEEQQSFNAYTRNGQSFVRFPDVRIVIFSIYYILCCKDQHHLNASKNKPTTNEGSNRT